VGLLIPMALNKTKLLWAAALLLSLTLSIFAVFRGGYIGPDYNFHFARLTEWPKVFDWSYSNPPLYYLFGHALFRIIGPHLGFPITLSIFQVILNALALWWFFVYSENRFDSRLVHLAFIFFLAFLPVRVIHAVTIGADSTTIPLFMMIVFLVDKFRLEPNATPRNAAFLSVALAISILTKYSFMALLPALLLIFVCLCANRKWGLQHFLIISALTLALPTAAAGYSFWASSRVHGYNTQKHWLGKGETPDMSYKDLLSVKANDFQLFRAPEYFKREILVAHKHSYLALSHMGTFGDPMNLFQDLSVPQHFGGDLIPDQKTRPVWKPPIMQASIALGTIWTLLALIGSAWIFWLAIKGLARADLEREQLTAILGTAYFLLMFLPIPFVHAGALFGYWTPRLILPALLYFFWAAFLLIDRKIARQRTIVAGVVLVFALIQCAIETVMLI
jgi:4-amino-4-deoxy-L-arabinose transferase-like glycosyltransferase